jgi:alanine dehydrogenase
VTILDVNLDRMRYLDEILPPNCRTVYSTALALREELPHVDLLVGAVLIHGAAAPKLVKREDLKLMRKGSVIVDVAVDQGGCVETCKPTTHDNPTYTVHDVVHYAVANMPGAVSRTSTFALANATIGYCKQLADHGLVKAAKADPALALGINTFRGHVPHKAVAEALGVDWAPLDKLI